MSVLYLVATPIGNMEDITLRALNTLKVVDVIACEDTRHSLVLLNRYEIKKTLISYHKHNERASSDKIIALLNVGKSVAVISDAGTPCVSDPGAIIARLARESGHSVTVIPGASAVISAVSLAGIDTGFVFVGFLPDKLKLRREIIDNLKSSAFPLVLYASPHDINGLIEFLYEQLKDREIHIIKELTKIYESITTARLLGFHIEDPRGEYVLIVMPSVIKPDTTTPVRAQVEVLISQGLDKKEAIKQVARSLNVNKNEIYREVMDIKD